MTTIHSAAGTQLLPTLVFVHGWGFDAHFWTALRSQLPDWPHYVLEAGYFAAPRNDEALPDGPVVMLGHSFGYMQALARHSDSVQAWISINGFARFCAGDDFTQGVAPRILQRMLRRLEQTPMNVVNTFRTACGAQPCVRDMNMPRLRSGLLAMRDHDLRAIQQALSVPVLALAGGRDPVVPPAMTEAQFRHDQTKWLPDGGHLLALTDPAWCAAHISRFLTRLRKSPAVGDHATASTHRSHDRRRCAGERFSAAASHYEAHAPVQHKVAAALARRIHNLDLPARPRILEIGCGTGLLTREISSRFADANWTVTDISASMLAQARRRTPLGGVVRFHVMDGEHPDLPDEEPFDLICSSMAMQWFANAPTALTRLSALLAPSGWMAIAVPVQGSFEEWLRAHRQLGLEAATIEFPRESSLFPAGGRAAGELVVETVRQRCGSALEFLRSLKGIGATAAREGHRPLSFAELRKVCAEFDRMGAFCSYRIAYSVWQREASGFGRRDHRAIAARSTI